MTRGAPGRRRAARAARPRWHGLRRALADLNAGVEGLLGSDRTRPGLVGELLGDPHRPEAPRAARPAPPRRRPVRRSGRGHLARVK